MQSPAAPLGVFDAFTTAVRVYFRNANTLLMIVLIIVIPVLVLTNLLVLASLPDELRTLETTGTNPFEGLTLSDFYGFFAAAVISGIISFVLGVVAMGACFDALGDALEGRTPDWQRSLRVAIAKVGSLVWLSVLVALLFIAAAIAAALVLGITALLAAELAMILGLVMFGGAVFMFVLWSVAVPVLMTEDTKGMKALWRSADLVKPRWWPTFGLYLIAAISMAIIGFVIGAIFGGRSADPNTLLVVLQDAISQLIFTPFQAAIVAVVYFDLRTRREGNDRYNASMT